MEDVSAYFDFNKAGRSGGAVDKFYTSVLEGKRNLKGKVGYLPTKFFLAGFTEPLRADNLDKANKYPLPVVDLTNLRKFGCGRVLMCKTRGYKEVPVLVCSVDINQIDDYITGARKYGQT